MGVGDNPPGFFTDEAAAEYDAYSILNSGKDQYAKRWPVFFKSLGDYKLPVFVYSAVPFVATLRLTETAVRVAVATYGTIAIFTTFLLAGVRFRQWWLAAAAAFFLAIAPWHIHYSRTGFGEMVSFLRFLTMGLYLFLMGARRNKLWLLSAVVLGLTLYTYRAAWVVLPPLLVFLVLLYHRELFKGWRLALPSFAILLLLGVPILSHISSDTRDRSEQTAIVRLELGNWGTVKGLGEWDTIKTFAGQYKSLLVLFPLAGALSNQSPISSRTILGSVTSALIAAYGLALLVGSLRRLRPPYGVATVAVALVAVGVLAGTAFASYLNRYHDEYPKLAAGFWGWQSGPREIIQHFVSVEDEYDQLVMDAQFNGADMFLRFYAPDGCKKCVTGFVSRYDPAKKQLFALRPTNLSDGYTYRTVGSIEYLNGEQAFSLVEITGLRQADPEP